MKVLQLPSWYLPEGGHFCMHQSLALMEQGVEVDILANVVLPWRTYKWRVFTYPFRSFYCNDYGIRTFRYYSWRIPFANTYNINHWIKKTVQLFDKYQKENGLPDIIHVHSSMWGGVAAARIKEKYGVPYIITEHRGIFGLYCDYAKSQFNPSQDELLAEAFSNADYIIPVSSQLMNKINLCLKRDVPVREIHNMLDTDFFYPTQRKRKPNEFRFVSVNGFYHVKAYDILLKSFDKLCELKKNISLRLVGENFEQPAFQELLSKCKNKDHISFSGELNCEGVRNELWNADAYVIASRVEAQSVSTIEAMATGLPVVSTIVNSPSIVTSSCGYRVPVENIDALADGMKKMIDEYDSFNQEDIAKHTKSIVSKDVIVKQILEVYNEVLGK